MGQSGPSSISDGRADAYDLKQTYIKFDGSGRRQKDGPKHFQKKIGNLEHSESQKINSSANDSQLWEAARAIINEAGATPLMDVVDKIQTLHGEIEKISDFLAHNLQHSPYDFFQEELDWCHQDSVSMVGVELSKFLVKVSEMDHINPLLMRSVVQIFMVSFCVSQWKPYFDKQHHSGKHCWLVTGSEFSFVPSSHRLESGPISRPKDCETPVLEAADQPI